MGDKGDAGTVSDSWRKMDDPPERRPEFRHSAVMPGVCQLVGPPGMDVHAELLIEGKKSLVVCPMMQGAQGDSI